MTKTDNEIEFEEASSTLAADGEDGFAERLKKLIALNGTVNALAKKPAFPIAVCCVICPVAIPRARYWWHWPRRPMSIWYGWRPDAVK